MCETEALSIGTPMSRKSSESECGGNSIEGLKRRLKGKLGTLSKCIESLVPRHPRWLACMLLMSVICVGRSLDDYETWKQAEILNYVAAAEKHGSTGATVAEIEMRVSKYDTVMLSGTNRAKRVHLFAQDIMRVLTGGTGKSHCLVLVNCGMCRDRWRQETCLCSADRHWLWAEASTMDP